MDRTRTTILTRARSDDGFTVVEVVVALVLLGIVASAALAFFVRAMQNTSHLQRSQAAVAVANQGMELVRSVNPRVVDATTNTSGLLIGRSKADSEAAWAAAAPTDTAQSNVVWDSAAASRPLVTNPLFAGQRAVVPVKRTATVSDMDFTITTLIGTCFRSATAATTDQTCVKSLSGNVAQLYRVTVVVTWDGSKPGQCGGGTCEYRVTTLVDPTVDANWNLTAKPVAYDDAITAVAGDTATLPTDVLVNDVIGAVTANPTTITVPPAFGTATAVAYNPGMGSIRFLPGNASGTTELRYKLKDAAGRQSNEATVLITVTPRAVNDAAVSVAAGDTVTIDVVANDFGTDLVPVVTSSGSGSTAVVGSQIVFTAPATTGSTSIKYRATDPSGGQSAEASVPVTVTAPVTPKVGNPLPSITIPYSAQATTVNLDVLAKTGNPTTFKILVTSPATAGSVTLNSPTPNVATFNQPAGLAPGTYTFRYRIQSTNNTTSPEGTYTITVGAPVAVADSGLTVARGKTVDFSLGTNDMPVSSDWNNQLKIVTSSSTNSNCGTVAVKNAQAGTVTIVGKNVSQTCTFTFTYSIQPNSGGGQSSNTVTNTVTVSR